MKKTLIAFACAAMTCAMLTSCTTTYPVSATSNPVGNKCGEATSTRVFGIGGSGNTGINKAAKNGGITKISHVDRTYSSFLWIIQKNKTRVYGE